jgi:endonuclease/exonuclease/phosphatase family metal-dependent hydrolase
MLLASYNIHFGVGRDNAYDLERIADEVANADIICLQEAIRGFPANEYADQAAEIAARLNRYFVYGSHSDTDQSEVAADGTVINRRRTFGNAVLSRWPIRTARALPLCKPHLPGVFDLHRGCVEAFVETPEGPMRVYSVHLSHISPSQRFPELQQLLDYVASAPATGVAWNEVPAMLGWPEDETPPLLPGTAVVMGDFNFAVPSGEYERVVGSRALGKGERRPVGDHLLDAWVLAGHDEGAGESFPREGRIDHCFVTADLAGAVRAAWVDDTATGSDHFPVFVEIAR